VSARGGCPSGDGVGDLVRGGPADGLDQQLAELESVVGLIAGFTGRRTDLELVDEALLHRGEAIGADAFGYP